VHAEPGWFSENGKVSGMADKALCVLAVSGADAPVGATSTPQATTNNVVNPNNQLRHADNRIRSASMWSDDTSRVSSRCALH
jgi:hypothetical protein